MKIDITDEMLVRAERDGEEGLIPELSRIEEEGLFEEVRLFVTTGVYGDQLGVQTNELTTLDPELAQQLIRALDLGVNVNPGHVQTLQLTIKYRYDYGQAPSQNRSYSREDIESGIKPRWMQPKA